MNEQWGISEHETDPSNGQIAGPPISGLMDHHTNIQPAVSENEGAGRGRQLLDSSPQSASGPKVGFHGAFEGDHGAQVGNGLPAHQAREAAGVDSRVSSDAPQALTRLEHRGIAGLDEQTNGDRVFGGVRSERAVRPISPIREPGIGRFVTAGHETHSGVYPAYKSGIEGIVMISDVLHMCIAFLKYAHHEGSRHTERSASAYPMRGAS